MSIPRKRTAKSYEGNTLSLSSMFNLTFSTVADIFMRWSGISMLNSRVRSVSGSFLQWMRAPPLLISLISPSTNPREVKILTGQVTSTLECARFSCFGTKLFSGNEGLLSYFARTWRMDSSINWFNRLPCKAARTLNRFSKSVSIVVLKRVFPGVFAISSTFWCTGHCGKNMPVQIANLMPKC